MHGFNNVYVTVTAHMMSPPICFESYIYAKQGVGGWIFDYVATEPTQLTPCQLTGYMYAR